MPNPSRVELHKSADIPARADEVWSLLTDWAGMLRWRLNAEQGGLPGPAMVKCELVGEYGAVPRTRRMVFNNGVVVEEQIFYQNDDTRRIYYSKSEAPGSELSGYVASAYVNEIDGSSCILHITSWFDAESQAASAAAAAWFATVYQGIFSGFRHYFSCRAAHQGR
jgi:Polyketide cyclase / dehydrase and lipid transport